jgi:hypothetical protein
MLLRMSLGVPAEGVMETARLLLERAVSIPSGMMRSIVGSECGTG